MSNKKTVAAPTKKTATAKPAANPVVKPQPKKVTPAAKPKPAKVSPTPPDKAVIKRSEVAKPGQTGKGLMKQKAKREAVICRVEKDADGGVTVTQLPAGSKPSVKIPSDKNAAIAARIASFNEQDEDLSIERTDAPEVESDDARFEREFNELNSVASVDALISGALKGESGPVATKGVPNATVLVSPKIKEKKEPRKQDTPRHITKGRGLHLTPASLNLKEGSIQQADLQNDDIYGPAEMVPLESLANTPTVSGVSNAIVSGGRIVSVVSENYGFLHNKQFFGEVEKKLAEAKIDYVKRSINRDNCHFAVDYILTGDKFNIDIKGTKKGIDDKITPMLRFTNSYAGAPTSGSFGFFRKVCNNGLHVTEKADGFRIRHKSNVEGVVLPEMDVLVQKFMDNEFFTLREKFEVLAETIVADMSGFVKFVCGKTELFSYERSEKNPDPSVNAELVMELANVEKNAIGAKDMNVWLGYNAFNQMIHSHFNRSFTEQRKLDRELFGAVLEYAELHHS